jgi:hypothetical protein
LNTPATLVKTPPPLWKRILIRVLIVVVVTTVFSLILNYSSESATSTQPAGFSKGLLHGALMPGAMPQLLMGHDVTIYAQNNTGRMYKLGYTAGVNGCGAIFFGVFYWRFSRWRKKRKVEGSDTPQ